MGHCGPERLCIASSYQDHRNSTVSVLAFWNLLQRSRRLEMSLNPAVASAMRLRVLRLPGAAITAYLSSSRDHDHARDTSPEDYCVCTLAAHHAMPGMTATPCCSCRISLCAASYCSACLGQEEGCRITHTSFFRNHVRIFWCCVRVLRLSIPSSKAGLHVTCIAHTAIPTSGHASLQWSTEAGASLARPRPYW